MGEKERPRAVTTQGRRQGHIGEGWHAVDMANAVIKGGGIGLLWLAGAAASGLGRRAHTELVNRRSRRIEKGSGR